MEQRTGEVGSKRNYGDVLRSDEEDGERRRRGRDDSFTLCFFDGFDPVAVSSDHKIVDSGGLLRVKLALVMVMVRSRESKDGGKGSGRDRRKS